MLVNFKRISVKEGKTAKLEIQIPVSVIARWNTKKKKQYTPKGKYLIPIAKSFENIVLEFDLTVK